MVDNGDDEGRREPDKELTLSRVLSRDWLPRLIPFGGTIRVPRYLGRLCRPRIPTYRDYVSENFKQQPRAASVNNDQGPCRALKRTMRPTVC